MPQEMTHTNGASADRPISLPARPARLAGPAALAVSIAAVVVSLPWTWFLLNEPIRDEVGHVPLVRRWIEHPDTVSLSRFREPKGIAVFTAARLWGKVVGTSCPALRAMIVLAGVATMAAWAWLVSLWPLSRKFAAGIALLTVPYFFIYTQLLYTEIPALLLTFLALACVEKLRQTGRWRWTLGVVVSLALLPWVRQTFVIVPAALLACSPWMGHHRLRVAAASVAGLAGLAVMLGLWGGTIPPTEAHRFGGIGFYPGAFAFALGVLGLLGWPMILAGLPRRREQALMTFGAVGGAALFVLMDIDYESVNRMGLLQKLLISLPGPPWLATAALAASMCTGGLVLGRLAYLVLRPGGHTWLRLAATIAVGNVLLHCFATNVFYDRYLILALVMIFAIAAERAGKLPAYAFIVLFGLLAAAHAAYITLHPQTHFVPVPLMWN